MLFSPSTVIADDTGAVSPEPTAAPENLDIANALEAPQDGQSEDPSKTPPVTDKPALVDGKALLDAINKDRQDREQALKDAQERDSYKKRAEEAEAKIADNEKAKANRILDPAGWLRKLGYSEKELALTAQGIMYSLVPDKMPPDHRANLVEAQMMRDREANENRDREREEKAQKSQTAAQATRGKELENQYTASLKAGVAEFKPGTYPMSQAWFGKDHESYAAALFATAREIATAATRAGTQADLSPINVAKVLENRKAPKTAPPAEQAKPTPSRVTKQTAPADDSGDDPFKIVTLNKKPQSKLTDKQLIARAAAVAFGPPQD